MHCIPVLSKFKNNYHHGNLLFFLRLCIHKYNNLKKFKLYFSTCEYAANNKYLNLITVRSVTHHPTQATSFVNLHWNGTRVR